MKYYLLFALMVTSGFANAGWTTSKIDRILFFEDANLIYVYPKGGIKTPPACHGSNGNYTSFSMSRPMAKEYLSGLMAAMLANKTVVLRTHGDCVDQSNSDTLMYFSIVNQI